MSRPIIFDGYVQRAMTEQEFGEWQTLCEQIKAQKQSQIEFANNQAAAKASARAKLAALGLTETEITTLVG